ncbi:hypothetical protein [Vibrio tapetis]|uniref:Outer membrane receptor protein n=1 Tax=Vibrio tapetis subsp. tapetis TaxID=1671868 RepID=A0A2N8ZAY4_9VIBR|nr:hypothetical protein [Vibrio tapetis]SON49080.1 conserved exported protein of unknown function [Vibrio tapetis subsp. tapetis]
MQNKEKWMHRSAALVILLLVNSCLYAEEQNVDENTASNKIKENTKCLDCKLGGMISGGYDTNIYNRNDHRSIRSLSWRLSLDYTFSSDYKAYFKTGGYRALEDKTGDYVTDSVIGMSRTQLFGFGESGKVGVSGQFTIPTSETSRKDSLNTAFRVAVPVSTKQWGINFSVTPRISKSFHEYKTAGEKSLTEWIYSLSLAAGYSWDDLSLGMSMLGGNSRSYQGTRRTDITYAGSIYGSYQVTNNIGISISASTSGFYTDAERGTLGNIDLFDPNSASYNVEISYSF